MGRKIKKHTLTLEFYATSPLYGKYNEICCSNEVIQSCIDHMQWIRGPLPVPQSPFYAAEKPPQSHLIYNVHLSFPPLPASASILSSRYILEVLLPFALFSSSTVVSSYSLPPCISLLIHVNPFAVRMKLV